MCGNPYIYKENILLIALVLYTWFALVTISSVPSSSSVNHMYPEPNSFAAASEKSVLKDEKFPNVDTISSYSGPWQEKIWFLVTLTQAGQSGYARLDCQLATWVAEKALACVRGGHMVLQ